MKIFEFHPLYQSYLWEGGGGGGGTKTSFKERRIAKKPNKLKNCVWFQLLTSPQATPGNSHILFAQPPEVLPTNLCQGGQGLPCRRGQIFPEMNENLLNNFIFRGCFQEAIQNGRKNSRFCLRKLHLSPRISLLNQLKE